MAIIKRPTIKPSSTFISNTDIIKHNSIDSIYSQAESLRIRTFPFDIITYLRRHGVVVIFEEMDDMSAYVHYKNGLFTVGINKYQNETRQRFSAAHELAHIINDSDDVIKGKFKEGEMIMFRDNNSVSQRERLANEFASELLMPKNTFNKLLKEGIRNIEELAHYFNVSPAAVKYRAYKLGYIQRY